MSESGVIPPPEERGYHMKVRIEDGLVHVWIGSLVLSLKPAEATNMASRLIEAANTVHADAARPWKQPQADVPP